MRKLKLDPETLRVESFTARDDARGAKGTVQAQSFLPTADPFATSCQDATAYCQETDFHWNTCGNSCVNMCFNTGPSCVD
ncbi:hypothetical protein [Longimicrobium sp.]|uniref:hypothetical protein n=1 Tax=Longimicrobium sp. TaxID=2029185 RepID=UPI002BB7E1D5|nr:hypothetical protein [Longimicrobium sp.]HSU14937.1 hypothetical protein [Longimicrobium sp.]